MITNANQKDWSFAISIILKTKAYIISLNTLSKAFGIRNSGAKLGVVVEEKNIQGFMNLNSGRNFYESI